MVGIAAAVVIVFIGGLYFLTHHKKETSGSLNNHQANGSNLPPKPEERWRYIKELESRQPSVRAPTEPSSGGESINSSQLTDEQRQLLAQMQADMLQQPTQLAEVPWNEQTPEQRQQTLQRQRLAQQSQQQQWSQPTPQPRQTHTTTQTAKTTTSNVPYQSTQQTPAPSQPKSQASSPAPVTNVTTPTEQTDTRSWMVQCGSFRGAEQAETARAKLAFEGFNSKISVNNGWNRVVIGPVKGKSAADSTIAQLKQAGHGNCIRFVSRG